MQVAVAARLAPRLLDEVELGDQLLRPARNVAQPLAFVAHGEQLLFDIVVQGQRSGNAKGKVLVGSRKVDGDVG